MYIRRQIRRLRDRVAFGRKEQWRHLFAPYVGDELVALDMETTSMDIKDAEILSIGAVIIKANRVKTSEKMQVTVTAPERLPVESVKVHMLRRIDLADGMPVEQAIEALLKFVGNRPLVGYYIAYDLAVLDKYMRPKLGFGMPNRSIDVVSLFRRRLASRAMHDCEMRLSFEDIAEQLHIPVVGRHSAIGDAVTTALMYVKMKGGRS
jgi:DNA polymerase-3 subunit epsilon